jgi:adenosylcobinamide kinase/adenosylcobinamide-phosphate guanylyltransferase
MAAQRASKVVFITGGARSGKSSFALKETERTEGHKVYIATAEALDDEMSARIEKHKRERSEEWQTIEEPYDLGKALGSIEDHVAVVLIDCLTLWTSNILIKYEHDPPVIEELIDGLIDSIMTLKDRIAVYIVSNEVGMGIVPDNPLSRTFRDLAGRLNQKVATFSDEVYLVMSGLPLKIKG